MLCPLACPVSRSLGGERELQGLVSQQSTAPGAQVRGTDLEGGSWDQLQVEVVGQGGREVPELLGDPQVVGGVRVAQEGPEEEA